MRLGSVITWRRSVSKARDAAHLLAKRFMVAGKMSVVPGSIGTSDEGIQLAAKLKREDAWEETQAFAILGVQAVGYSDGIESESGERSPPEVVVYAAKTTVKEINALAKSVVAGVSVRIRKIGLVTVHPDDVDGVETEPHAYVCENGRVACGGSCSTATGYAGTIGALVRKAKDDSIYLLSCNHVIAACNQIDPGMPIMAPAPDDARPDKVLPLSIARLHEAILLQTGSLGLAGSGEEDLALGRIINPDLVSSWQGDPENGFDTPTEIVDAKPGMKVKKFGRTTGLTFGVVDALVAEPYPVHCQSKKFKGEVWFRNIVYVDGQGEAFALPGDSGSLVVTEDGTKAVGLLFSSNGNGEFGQLIPMRHVAGKLGVSLINGHGI
jgi:hypothetical protein